MKKRLITAVAVGGFLLGGAYYLYAQMGGGQMGMQQRPMGMMAQGGMGGGAAMVVYGKYIYVLQGPRLIKVDPVKMAVVKELALKASAKAGDGRMQRGGMPADDMWGDE